MKSLPYQRRAVERLVNETIKLLKLGGKRRKIVFEAPTGSGKTVMACQALAEIVDELKNRGDCDHREVAFIWFAPRKLHIQSYAALKDAFGETRRLRPVMFDDLDQNEGLQSDEILFVNWESVNKATNIMVRESESSSSLYEIVERTQKRLGLPIIAVIDEEHMFWSNKADKTAEVLNRINPAIEIRISATPKTIHPDELVKVQRQEVVEAEMIKKEVVLNCDIELNFTNERTLNANLIDAAWQKRNQIDEAYQELGVKINPLLLIQLPNDTKETLTAEDAAVAQQVKQYLEYSCKVTEENGLLAVWLANEKANLANLEKVDNRTKVLLFKEAIALGWDCPRAAVLLIFRKLESAQFTVQTVGRILRMPEQKHYPNELLNRGYVYTDIAKDRIQIVTADSDYLLKNTLIAHRRGDLKNVSLKSYYSERPNAGRNYLGPDFRKTLYQTARKFWNIPGIEVFAPQTYSSLDQIDGDESISDSDKAHYVGENCRSMANDAQNAICLDVREVDVEIPKDVHFQNETQIIEVEQVKIARNASEIGQVFRTYISGQGRQFESKGRADKISTYLLELLERAFGVAGTDAQKVVLCPGNRPKFDRLLDSALSAYATDRDEAKQGTTRQLVPYEWEVPEERIYDEDNNHKEEEVNNHALKPFVTLNKVSNPEKEFIRFLEENTQYIDWWYKNGDKGKQHFAIPYDKGRSLFYVDFIIRMKNGHVYLFDTKTAGSDLFAPDKHNALLEYIRENSTEKVPLDGGIIIMKGSNWLYSHSPIEDTTDTDDWDGFYPENA